MFVDLHTYIHTYVRTYVLPTSVGIQYLLGTHVYTPPPPVGNTLSFLFLGDGHAMIA